MPHPLEVAYGLTASEMLDAVARRFRLRVALEGGIAEVQMEKHIQALVGTLIDRYEVHDLDGYPDFSLWLPGRDLPLKAECKNVRDSKQAYRRKGEAVAFMVETQKTRAAKADPTSRSYGLDQFDVLGVCLGKKTGTWSDFMFIRTVHLVRQTKRPDKLATMQRVPLPEAEGIAPWSRSLGDLVRTL
jgi:hypothetical protein